MDRVDLSTGRLADREPAAAPVEIPIAGGRGARRSAVENARLTGAPIAVPFAKFNDGRGFSIAHLLRSEHGFTGEILATGHLIPDQALHLLRAGFDTVQLADKERLPHWQRALEAYGGAYQSALRNPLLRRREASLRRHLRVA